MKLISNAKHGESPKNGTIFTADIRGAKITIHRLFHLEGWWLSCYELGIEKQKLKAETITDAIEESKGILKAKVDTLERAVEIFSNETVEFSKY